MSASGCSQSRPTKLLHPVPSVLYPAFAALILVVHGYHPWAEDAGLYVAGIRHILDPSLYPLNAAFPAAFAKFSVFPWLAAGLTHFSHLPLAWILLCAHLLSILLFLVAVGRLAKRLFLTNSARWCAVLLAAGCFALPVAGTALRLMDPYVTARSFSTPLGLLALAAAIERAWLRAGLLLALAALLHPLMAVWAAAFLLLYACVAAGHVRAAIAVCIAAIVACGIAFVLAHGQPVSAAYREAVSLAPRSFLFLARWQWYEILGLALPLLLYAVALKKLAPSSPIRALCLTCLLLGITATAIAALFVPTAGPYPLVPLQVLRSFHLIYAVGMVLCAGLIASVARNSRAAVATLFVLLFAGMFVSERLTWSGSSRIEWPGAAAANPWQQAFTWIATRTPRDAVFAFDPRLVYLPEEDEQGFRAITGRDHLADDKDAGVAAVIPRLAGRWALQRNAELSLDSMSDAERRASLGRLGVNWLLLPPNAQTNFSCPYRNRVIQVCPMK